MHTFNIFCQNHNENIPTMSLQGISTSAAASTNSSSYNLIIIIITYTFLFCHKVLTSILACLRNKSQRMWTIQIMSQVSQHAWTINPGWAGNCSSAAHTMLRD